MLARLVEWPLVIEHPVFLANNSQCPRVNDSRSLPVSLVKSAQFRWATPKVRSTRSSFCLPKSLDGFVHSFLMVGLRSDCPINQKHIQPDGAVGERQHPDSIGQERLPVGSYTGTGQKFTLYAQRLLLGHFGESYQTGHDKSRPPSATLL